nr:MAG: nonstructural protein NS1 [Bee densovirus 7]
MQDGVQSRDEFGSLFGEDLGDQQDARSEPSNLVDVSDEQCAYFTGGSEFEQPLRLRHIKKMYPEDYESLGRQLQEVVGRWTRAIDRQKFNSSKRYISDVIVINDDDHRSRLLKWVSECGPSFPGGLLIYVNEGDHIHFVHDCPYSGNTCRCKFTKTPDFRRPIRDPMRRLRFINDLDEIDWANVILYFIMSKWQSRPQIWIGGRLQGLPTNSEIIRWSNLSKQSRAILDREIERDGCNDQPGQSNNEENRKRVSRSAPEPEKKRGKFERIAEEVQTLLNKYNCIPPDHIRDIIPPTTKEYKMEWHNPANDKIFDASCHLYSLSVNNKKLNDFYEQYESGMPIFYANNLDPFEYYHDRETSANYLNELLKFQCGGDEDEVKKLLSNIKSWFNKVGWSQFNENSEKYEINSKINCVVIVGPPNSGKNYFWDCVAAIATNVGHIGRVNNKTNQFALQDAYCKRLVMGNEISMEEGAKEDFKKLCEGTAFNIRVKYKGDKIFTKTPVCLISNSELDICGDPHFNNVRIKTLYWRTCNLLAESKKKPYPLAIFDLYNLYNISIK